MINDADQERKNAIDKLNESISQLLALMIVVIVSAFLLKISWNAVMPYLFSLKIITYWQALCMTIMVNTLFKSKVIK